MIKPKIMQKQELIHKLQENHQALFSFVEALSDEQFMASVDDKWTAGQELEHIYRSIKPLAHGLITPAFLFGLLFGKNNRASRTYHELVEKYVEKLAAGAVATPSFEPLAIALDQKQELLEKNKKAIAKMISYLQRFSEEDLDKYVIPHPLLGKITLREMMYFTIYHAEHHLNNMKRNLVI